MSGYLVDSWMDRVDICIQIIAYEHNVLFSLD